MSQQLSEHFSLTEFTSSNTAARRGIDNTAPPTVIAAGRSLCENVLELVRSHYKLPVHILSGYRCAELNQAIGGAADSQHVLGEAADITIPGVENKDLWAFIKSTGVFDQLIAEHLKESDGAAGWIHVSYRANHLRKQDLSGIYVGSATQYVPGLKFDA